MTTSYRGPLKAVIFDWAGTIVDYGSRAPMGVFVKVFERFGVTISIDEARIPMGLPKWDHIKAVGTLPRVADQWQQVHGRPFTDTDVDAIYKVFTPMNVAVIPDYADIIPGALETVAALRARGLKIGSTTGYNRRIMEVLAPIAATKGYAPDCLVCAGDLAAGRPTPLMMYRCFTELNVWPATACVKVDDTAPGITEGLGAGAWTVGVAVSGNAFGLSAEEAAALPKPEFDVRRSAACAELERSGAHFVIDSVAELLPVMDEIDRRLREGADKTLVT
jgi:phosphonoacetaldehyde hydrolase